MHMTVFSDSEQRATSRFAKYLGGPVIQEYCSPGNGYPILFPNDFNIERIFQADESINLRRILDHFSRLLYSLNNDVRVT